MKENYDELRNNDGLYIIDVVNVSNKELKSSLDVFQNKIKDCKNKKVKELYQNMLNSFFVKGEDCNESYSA